MGASVNSLKSVLFFFSSIAFCQSGASDSEQWIRQMLYNPPQGVTGFELKRWPNLGDAAAPLISKVLNGAKPDEVIIARILGVISIAFVRPATVPNVADREPKATLVFLDRLGDSTQDAALKSKITATRKYILDQFAKSSVKDSEECLVGNYTTALAIRSAPAQTFRLSEAFSLLTENFDGELHVPSLSYVGDALASDLNVIVGSCTLSGVEEHRALEMVHASFERPNLIQDSSDREPRSTLVFLDGLATATQNSETRSMIIETRRFVAAR